MKSLIITYGLTAIGPLISLFRPYYGFLIYICFAIIKPDSLWSYSVPRGNYSRIIALGMLVGWVLVGFGTWGFGRGKAILAALIGYVLVLLVATATSPLPELGWPSVEIMAKVVVAMLVGASLIDSWAKLRQLTWVIVLSQGYLAYEFNLMYFRRTFHSDTFKHAGLDNNGMALTMVTAFGMAFFLGMYAPKLWQRLLALGCALLMAHVVMFSNSRGAMLSLALTGMTSFLLIPKKPRHYLFFALALLVAGVLAGPGVQKRLSTTFKSKSEGSDRGGSRLDQWKACCQSMARHPLGIGTGMWPIVTETEYGLPSLMAHSTWLQVGAEEGIPGLIFLFAFYLLCVLGLWRYTRERVAVPDPWTHHLARMVIASLSGFLLAAQFITVDTVELSYFAVLIGIGILKLVASQAVEMHPHLESDSAAQAGLAPPAAVMAGGGVHL